MKQDALKRQQTSAESKKSSSAVTKRPHDASCLSVVSVNSTIPQAQFFCY